MSDEEISEKAVEFVKLNKKIIIEKFAPVEIYKSQENPETFFMAGSPGAGKTETSKDFIAGVEKIINEKLGIANECKIVRVDGDDIRNLLPNYNGGNSDLFQRAISHGVDKLVDYCFGKNLSMLVDGTFSTKNSLNNIERAIKHKRIPHIIYVYQDPLIAWELTKARESKDGRMVPLEAFVDAFFLAKDNANLAKKNWGSNVRLHYAEKNFETGLIKYKVNIDDIDKCLKIEYNKNSLIEAIKANNKCN